MISQNIDSEFPTAANIEDICYSEILCLLANWVATNDSLHIQSYTPSPATYAGLQRKGISQSITEATSVIDHIVGVGGRIPSHFREPTPLPKDVRNSLNPLPIRRTVGFHSFGNATPIHYAM